MKLQIEKKYKLIRYILSYINFSRLEKARHFFVTLHYNRKAISRHA